MIVSSKSLVRPKEFQDTMEMESAPDGHLTPSQEKIISEGFFQMEKELNETGGLSSSHQSLSGLTQEYGHTDLSAQPLWDEDAIEEYSNAEFKPSSETSSPYPGTDFDEDTQFMGPLDAPSDLDIDLAKPSFQAVLQPLQAIDHDTDMLDLALLSPPLTNTDHVNHIEDHVDLYVVDDFSRVNYFPAETPEQPDTLSSTVVENRPTKFWTIPRPKYPIQKSQVDPRPFSWEVQRDLVKWTQSFQLGGRPKWRVEPDLDLVKSTVSNVLNNLDFNGDESTVEYMMTGGYNSVYTIETTDKQTGQAAEFIFRVPLPEDPYYKMECEVATTEFVRHFTSIPVPTIYAYDSSTSNELGLEWMLMEKVKGNTLYQGWLDLDNETHARIARQVADWEDQLSRIKSNLVGGIYLRWTETQLEFFIGRLALGQFAENRRLLYNVDRGPFSTHSAFFDSMLHLALKEVEDPVLHALAIRSAEEDEGVKVDDQDPLSKALIAEAIHKDDIENWVDDGPHVYNWGGKIPTTKDVEAFREALPKILSASAANSCGTFLQHNDISQNNILIDSDGSLMALLDWEHVGFFPKTFHQLWPVCFTGFRGTDREDDESDIIYNPTSLDWSNITVAMEDVVATQLRRIYKRRLEELESSLLQAFTDDNADEPHEDQVWQIVNNPFRSHGINELIRECLAEDTDSGWSESAGLEDGSESRKRKRQLS
ncbi:hypothetical protein MMC18_004465 [Xylographa bjoerkii]|nr:hypothetical protein [Xylographa bjoerkii]